MITSPSTTTMATTAATAIPAIAPADRPVAIVTGGSLASIGTLKSERGDIINESRKDNKWELGIW